MPEIDFVIVTALAIESEVFDEHLQEKENYINQFLNVKIGSIHHKKVAIVISEIGETNAAIATTLMIQQCQPKNLIFTGIAGTLNHALAIGDVIVGETVFSAELMARYQSGKYIECKFGILPSPKYCLSENALATLKKLESQEHTFTVKPGVIATSDEFPLSINIGSCVEDSKQVDAVDMESAAFAQTCLKFKKSWCVVRGISNYVDAEKNALIEKENVFLAAKNAAAVTVKMIENF